MGGGSGGEKEREEDGLSVECDDNALEKERKHYFEVRESFVLYSESEGHIPERLQAHLDRLSPELRKRVPESALRRPLEVERAIRINQAFLDSVVREQDEISQFETPERLRDLGRLREVARKAGSERQSPVAPHNRSKVRSTLHQLVRDWSAEGRKERDQSYGALRRELQRVLPVTNLNRNKQKVLVPGSGLGRLVFDIVCDGYAAQGNEFSYQMLFVSNFILNCGLGKEQMAICPFIDTPCNHFNSGDMYREVLVPDVSVGDTFEECSRLLEAGDYPNMSMAAGEWLLVYGESEGEWDAVVTCFFIDTAPIVMEYIETIHRMLRPGGLWINLGPLLYHWASFHTSSEDMRYRQSIELSCDEIMQVAQDYGFTIENTSRHDCNYTCNELSMMQTVYKSCLFTARKPPSPQTQTRADMKKK